METVKEFCKSSSPELGTICARVIGNMEQAQIKDIMESQEFPLVRYLCVDSLQ